MVQTRLRAYHRKRDFRRTREPSGEQTVAASGQLYVMHKHAARHDHFDLRIEQDGVLRSWALPRGPSLESGEKRLAVEVEDHPLDYGAFEGTIPEGEYGAGTVMLWDQGVWQPNGRNDADQLDFVLDGEKLKGAWTLVRTRGKDRGKQSQWLLIKRSDRSPRRLEPDDRSVISGRSMAQIAGAEASVSRAGTLSGARQAPLPERIAPQLATLNEHAPHGADWLHEIKFDGYRILARIDQGKVRLLTRNGHDWAARFQAQARQLQQLPLEQAFLDGEMVAVTAAGVSDFSGLQEALSRKQTARLCYQLFDLPYLDGHDLSAVPLEERKRLLAELLASTAGSTPLLRYSDHVRGEGEAFFEQARELGLEGIVSKRADAPYRSGRGTLWRKLKCTRHDEFVVGGFSPPAGSRSGFGALLLGAWRDGADEDQLVYMGRVGTGFSEYMLNDLYDQLQRLVTDKAPFAPGPALAQVPRGTQWVTPRLVAEVEYAERTGDGLLRHSRFRGLREDRRPEEIRLDEEPPVTSPTVRQNDSARVAGITLTHPERTLYPDPGVTKLELARYYAAIADWMLPWLANRPLSLLRCPDGQDQECFFQKHPDNSLGKNIGRVAITENDGPRDYVYVRSLSDIIALVQHGVLEFHPWGCQVEDIEHPDLLVFDLDPAPEVAWERVLDTARALRDRLEGLGFTAYARLTGGKGLHVVVPLEPRADWATAKAFAKALSAQQVRDAPGRLTVQMAKSKRRGRIFIDYLRNGRGATAIASYSTRARPGAPVAVPVRWDELSPALRADRYTLNNLRRRLGALKHDPWEDFYEAAVPLDADRLRAVGLQP